MEYHICKLRIWEGGDDWLLKTMINKQIFNQLSFIQQHYLLFIYLIKILSQKLVKNMFGGAREPDVVMWKDGLCELWGICMFIILKLLKNLQFAPLFPKSTGIHPL